MSAREIFSRAALAHFETTDHPIHAVDPLTGIALIYRFEEGCGGVLTCYDGPLGNATHTSPVPLHALNEVASNLCDGHASPIRPRPAARRP